MGRSLRSRGLGGLGLRLGGSLGLGRRLGRRGDRGGGFQRGHDGLQVAGLGVEQGLRRQVDNAIPSGRLAGAGDGGDAQHGLGLAMAAGAAIALAAGLLEDPDLFALAGLDQGGVDRGALDGGRAHGDRGAVAEHQDVREGHVRTGLAAQLFDHQHVAGFDPVLFAAGPDHRVHDWRPEEVTKKMAPAGNPAGGSGLLYRRTRPSQRARVQSARPAGPSPAPARACPLQWAARAAETSWKTRRRSGEPLGTCGARTATA